MHDSIVHEHDKSWTDVTPNVWTYLSYRHIPVNVQSDQQGRRHQKVLYYEDHRERPHALLPMERAASLSINPPLVHQCREYTLQEPSEALNTCAREERSAATGKTPLVIYSLFLIARVWVVLWERGLGAYSKKCTQYNGRGRNETSASGPDWMTVVIHKKRTTTPTECSSASPVVKYPSGGGRMCASLDGLRGDCTSLRENTSGHET